MKTTIPALEAKNVSFSYNRTQGGCIHDLSLSLAPGKFYGLIGPNGSGKSTFLDLLSGYLQPYTGKILLQGKEINSYSKREVADHISTVPQSFSLNFDYSVEEVVLMGRYIHVPRFSTAGPIDHEIAENCIAQMGITHLKNRKVTRLSGGEKQRVMIARSLAQETEIILLDEVTSNLDINHSITIMKTMSRLVEHEGRTVIAAMHDLNTASIFCNELIVLNQGNLHRFGQVNDIISEELLRELYDVQSHISSTPEGKKHIRFTYI